MNTFEVSQMLSKKNPSLEELEEYFEAHQRSPDKENDSDFRNKSKALGELFGMLKQLF